jgi:RasGEF domain
MSKTKAVDAPNVLEMIVRFNCGNRWLQCEIVSEEDFDTRLAILRYIVQLLKHLLVMNNFNCAFQVTSALSSSAIFRLKRTFDALTPYLVFQFSTF